MRFLGRSLLGIFLLSMTIAILAVAVNTVRTAVEARMADDGRSFPRRERVVAVNVIAVEPSVITPQMQVFGTLRSERVLDLRAAVGGTVETAHPALADGGRVASGDLILSIDPTDAQAALSRAQADLADAEAELRDADRALALGADELAAAEEQAELRQQALVRSRDLLDRGTGTAAAVETAELAVSSANAAVLSRRQSIAQAESRVDLAATRLDRAGIALDEAERTLAETEIFAPFSGTLSGVNVGLGGRLNANEQIAQLVDPDALEVAFRVSTRQYARLIDDGGQLRNAALTVTLDADGVDLTASGTITRESAEVGEGQTGRLLFASLDRPRGFRPGDFVTVSVTEDPLPGVALLPATAVAADGTVLVLGPEDRLERLPAAVLRTQGDHVIVEARAIAGREVVAELSPLLGEGIKVAPNRPGAAREEPAPPEMIALDPDRKARIVAFVTDSRMPEDAKARILSQLEGDEVPAEVVARIESRMGG
ncbi:HlyD family efflux transporter periplasmic adaptor subunit [Loktanella sp. IMCC34160]|nr:HlyD family efflux transporter periplasmic adaptor subunit [Loktanella sp. IMCC34160]RYG89363.1 HlyD family efflux transporter periplasmic adaptor subunit [Loktanella sp. IMCC34160]